MAASLVCCGAVPCAIVFAVFCWFGEKVSTAFWLAAALSDRTLPAL